MKKEDYEMLQGEIQKVVLALDEDMRAVLDTSNNNEPYFFLDMRAAEQTADTILHHRYIRECDPGEDRTLASAKKWGATIKDDEDLAKLRRFIFDIKEAYKRAPEDVKPLLSRILDGVCTIRELATAGGKMTAREDLDSYRVGSLHRDF